MKKLLLIILVFCSFAAHAQVAVYWRNEASNGNWEWGSTCDAGSDGNWYYTSPWNGNRKRPDCYGAKYIHIDNNNQTTMELNSLEDYSALQIIFDSGASSPRTINSTAGRKIYFKTGGTCKIENYATATHTISPAISFENDTEINPINGDLVLNGTITTAGYAIRVYGPNAKNLIINGTITGSGSLSIKQNSVVQLNGSNTYTGSTTVESGTLQLNNSSGAVPANAAITVYSGATLKISKDQTLNTITLQSGANLVIDNGATLTLTGQMITAGTLTNNGTLKLNISGGTYNFPGTVSIASFKNLEIAAGTVTLSANVTPVNLTLSGGTLDVATYTANGTGSLLLSNGTLKIGGTNTLPAGYTGYTVSSVNTVEYYGTSQQIALPGSQKYGNLILSGSGQKTLAASIGVAANLTIQNGTALIVTSGKTLTVDNSIINNGNAASLTIANNAALVQTNNTANTGQILQYKNSNSLYRLDYTLWSSPVAGQNLLAFSPATTTTRFYEYRYGTNSAGQSLEAYFVVDAANNNFTPGKGYLIRMPNTLPDITGYDTGTTATPYNGTFSGTPNNGTVNISISAQGNRYTSVGNPYPSPISVADFFSQNSSVLDTNGAIYLWRKKNNNGSSAYATLTLAAYTANGSGTNTANATGGQDAATYFTGNNSAWVLAPGQGFIVRAKTGVSTPVLQFTNSMRRAVPGSGQAFLRSTSTPAIPRFWLNISNENSTYSQIAVAYMEGATTGNDFALDGARFTEENTLQLYSISANEKYAVQARPTFINTDVVPLGYNAPQAGTYTISIDRTEDIFENNQQIYLYDNAEGIVRNISAQNYTFTTNEGTYDNRFEIHYNTTLLSTENNVAPEINVFKTNNAITITSNSLLQYVHLYDLNGRLLYSGPASGVQSEINTGITQNNIYLIKITTDNGTITKKFMY